MSSVPMTQSQSLIHAGQVLAGSSPLYNMAWRFDLRFAVDPAVFARAFEHVAKSNEALSVSFNGAGRAIEQTRCAPISFPPFLDFSGETDPEEAVSDWVKTRAKRAIDLGKTTYDTCLIKLGSDHWVWFLNQHHIATDAWSGSLIFKAVSEAYEAISGGEAMPSAPPQFQEYAVYEAEQRKKSKDTASEAYWAAREGKGGLNATPYGGLREASEYASRRVSVPFGTARTKSLKALAQSEGFRSISADLSIFALLATGYMSFLNRVTGQSDVVLGTPAHNRATPLFKETAGLFIEMFPLAVEVGSSSSFEGLYKAVMAETMGFLRHAKPGLATVAASSSFNAVLNYIPVSYGDFARQQTDVTWLHPGAHDARHDVRLHVYDFEDSGCFTVEFDLNTKVFEGIKDQDVVEHYLALMDALLEDPSQNPAHVALSKSQPSVLVGEQVFSEFNVLEAFRDIVAKTPDQVAAQSGSISLSYSELDALSNGYAERLSDMGVLRGDPVVVHSGRSLELIAGLLGVLKTGAYFVPISADAPGERVATICRLATPKAVLSDTDLAYDCPVLELGAVAASAFETVLCDGPSSAYAIFTSGSTGEPKGVLVDWAGFSEYIRWAGASFGDEGPKSYPLYSSIGFDLTITSLFVPLTTGGRIVVYPESGHGSDLSVLDVFREDIVDVVKLTPSHLSLACLDAPKPERIKTLVMGGENLSRELSLRAQDVLGQDLRIINEYGPTEAVVGCMIHEFDRGVDLRSSVSVGKPAHNVSIYVLDEGHNPVPIGVTGEIYIGGSRLSRGYLGRDDLTAERFLPDPFGDGLMYKSGDLARVGADGLVSYLGRADGQLKINGVRIEPSEIEAALGAIEGVEQAFVKAHQKSRPKAVQAVAHCVACGIANDVPHLSFNGDGLCQTCSDFEAYKERANAYFKPEAELGRIVEGLPSKKTGSYDAIVLLSGGKDSTYALYRFAELTDNVLALTLDNGYISDGAKRNIELVCKDLGVDHRFLTTPAMNSIFADSLTKHSNVCQGCFKTIYTLALKVARDEGIPAIVTGLSRGQFFETRLSPQLFENRDPSTEELEDFVLEARKSYHRMDDEISRQLNAKDMFDDQLFEDIELIDVYRYIDVPVQEIYDFLSTRASWIRPDDTGRSTNCLINDVGIYVHKKRMGFHNYALPYSWDVRMGHKTRSEAMEELDDEIDVPRAHEILGEIGFDMGLLNEDTSPRLVAYVVAQDGLDEAAIRSALGAKLLPAMIPSHIVLLDALPLTGNGKVDERALPEPSSETGPKGTYVAPTGEIETAFCEMYQEIIGTTRIGVTDNFYDMGGDSIAAIQIAILAGEQGFEIDANHIFEFQTIRELSRHAKPSFETAAPADTAPLIDLDLGDMDAIASQISGLK